MRTPVLVSLLLTCTVLLGCPKKKEDAEAGTDAGEVAEAAAAAPADDAAAAPIAVNAKNSADVARFPGETLVPDDDAKLGQPTVARVAPKTGAAVATLQPNADVHKVAEYQGSILCAFPDPKDANTQLMGWIPKESFNRIVTVVKTDAGVKLDAAAPTPVVVDSGAAPNPAKLTCPTGQAPVQVGTTAVCKKKCAADKDCTKPPCAAMQQQGGGLVKACQND